MNRGKRTSLLTYDKYKQFKADNPDLKVSFQEWTSIIRESNKEISNVILDDPTGFKLPYNLGYLVVVKYKQHKEIIDGGASKKYGKKVVYTNMHSFGHMYTIKWYNTIRGKRHRNKLLKYYKFFAIRKTKRDLAKIIKNGGYNKYLHLVKRNFYNTLHNKI